MDDYKPWKYHTHTPGGHDATSPVIAELERRGMKFRPLCDGWVECRGYCITLWPGDDDGLYGCAAGSPQYATREYGFRYTLGELLANRYLQAEPWSPRPDSIEELAKAKHV